MDRMGIVLRMHLNGSCSQRSAVCESKRIHMASLDSSGQVGTEGEPVFSDRELSKRSRRDGSVLDVAHNIATVPVRDSFVFWSGV